MSVGVYPTLDQGSSSVIARAADIADAVVVGTGIGDMTFPAASVAMSSKEADVASIAGPPRR